MSADYGVDALEWVTSLPLEIAQRRLDEDLWRVYRGKSQLYSLTATPLRPFLLTIIMSSERSPGTNRMRKIAGSFKGKISSLLHLSRAPTPSSIEMDSSSGNPTRWVTKFFSSTFHWNGFVLLSVSPLPVVGADHAPTEAYTLSPDPSIFKQPWVFHWTPACNLHVWPEEKLTSFSI